MVRVAGIGYVAVELLAGIAFLVRGALALAARRLPAPAESAFWVAGAVAVALPLLTPTTFAWDFEGDWGGG